MANLSRESDAMHAPSRMKAVVQGGYGPPDEVLRLEEVDAPRIADDEVLVKVRAASVHADVWHVVTGRPFALRLMGSGHPRGAEVFAGDRETHAEDRPGLSAGGGAGGAAKGRILIAPA